MRVKILYAITVISFLFFSFPPISILLGLEIFCDASIFVFSMGLETKANVYLPLIMTFGIMIIILLSFYTNIEVKKITKEADSMLDKNNKTEIMNYDKLRIEYGYLIPLFTTLFTGLLSYLKVFKNSGFGILLIIFSGVIQLIITFVVFYNEVQLLKFISDKS